MPADRMPLAPSKLGLIWSLPALNSARCFAKVVTPSPGHSALRILGRHVPDSLGLDHGRTQQQQGCDKVAKNPHSFRSNPSLIHGQHSNERIERMADIVVA
jgi:hypothetical protein